MTEEQMRNEVMYKISVVMLKNMLEKGIITKKEYDEINILNLETFSPELKELYI
jgi:hypothetical protein